MLHRSDAMAQTVQDLLRAALPTQARRGDSLGIWTFNEDLFTGLIPLQQWTPETQKIVTDRTVGFVRAQKLEKKSRLDKVILALNKVVRNSPFITVILICVGDEEVHGTPFDQRINGFFQSWHQQQLDARTPFVIAMRAQAGVFVDCSMNPAPWPAELPALPKELFMPIPLARPAISETRKPATSSVPPLIISGRKREPLLPPTNGTASTAIPPVPVAGAANPTTQAQPASTAGITPQSSRETTASPPLKNTTEAVPPSTSLPPVATAQIQASQKFEPPTQISHPLTDERALAPVTENTTKGPSNLPTMLAANAGSTAIVAQRLPSSGSAPVQPNPGAADSAQHLGSGSSSPAVEVGTIGATKSHLQSVILCLAASLSLGAILAAIWIWRRRSRSTGGEVSLITESIDRRKR